MSKIIQFLNSPKCVVFTIVLTVLLHVFFLNMPPKSMHLWRQANTLAMARNFYEEGMNVFEPRVDNRFETDGITGSQFPSFEILLASIYQLSGEIYFIQRAYCLLLHLLGIWGIYLLTNALTSNRLISNIASWAYTWSPMLFYYAITALPDDLALPASIWGLYFFLKWFKSWVLENQSSTFYMLMALLLVTLAGLTKLQYLALCFFILAYVYQQKHVLTVKHWVGFAIFGALTSGISLAWYKYASWLILKSGLTDIGLTLNPETDLKTGFSILMSNLTQSLPELILNYVSFAFLLASGYFLFVRKTDNSILRNAFFAWAGIFVVYHLFELVRMQHHDYYMMPYLPILTIASAYGAFHLFQNPKLRIYLVVLLLAQPILAFARIVPSRFLEDEKSATNVFYNEASLLKLQNAVPNNALCVVGPDNSRCIYFYFLRKKGFCFLEEVPFEASQLKDYIKRGAKYMYVSRRSIVEDAQFKPYFNQLICQQDSFYVYSLKMPKK